MSLAVAFLVSAIATGQPQVLRLPDAKALAPVVGPVAPDRPSVLSAGDTKALDALVAERTRRAGPGRGVGDRVCAAPMVVPAAQPDEPRGQGARRLDRLPPHQHYLTVLRREGGCEVAVIREDGRNRVVPLPHQRGFQRLEPLALSR